MTYDSPPDTLALEREAVTLPRTPARHFYDLNKMPTVTVTLRGILFISRMWCYWTKSHSRRNRSRPVDQFFHNFAERGWFTILIIPNLFRLPSNGPAHIVSCVKSWIQRRVRKLKSCGGTSFRLQMWIVRWKRWCHMLNVTHRHVFVSQKVCRHSSCSVRTCAWTRLVDDTFLWKRGSRD